MLKKDLLGRVVPQAVEIEEAVLGACMLDSTAFAKVSVLKPEMFYKSEFGIIFKAVSDLAHRGAPVDILTVADELKRTGLLKEAGDYAGIAEITNRVASAANVEHHAKIVWEKHVARSAIQSSYAMVQKLFDGDDVPESIAEHEAFLVSLMQGGGEARTSSQVVQAMIERAKRIAERGGKVGLPVFGHTGIDSVIGGGEEGDLICIAGRPKSGKSSVMNNSVWYHAVNKIPALFRSGEMQNIKTGYRAAAAITGIPTSVLETGEWLNSPNKIAMEEALAVISQAPLFFDDSELSIPKMRAEVMKYYHLGVRTFFYDRLGLFKEVSGSKDENRGRMEVSSAMRSIANQYKIVIVVFSQINADAERTSSKRPEARHIYGATAIQANCTKAVIVHRPEMYAIAYMEDGQSSKGLAEIYSVLNSYGKTESVIVKFDSRCQVFREDDDLGITETVNVKFETDEDLPF